MVGNNIFFILLSTTKYVYMNKKPEASTLSVDSTSYKEIKITYLQNHNGQEYNSGTWQDITGNEPSSVILKTEDNVDERLCKNIN